MITLSTVQDAFNPRLYPLGYLDDRERRKTSFVLFRCGVAGLIEPDCRIPKVASQD
jgi:hypothetical protein